jgi:hypothetical protein
MSQNKPFLFLSYLSQILCCSEKKLTDTQR